MKDSDVPELNYAWWKKNQPTTLPSTGLGEALRAFEAAREKAQPTDDLTAIADRLKVYADAIEKLDGVTTAVGTAQKKCNKVLHATCLKVLTKYPSIIVKEDVALKKERDAMQGHAVETCKSECAKVISDIIGFVKQLEPKLGELEELEGEANDTREEVAKAVSSKEPNAGELEVTITEGHVREALRIVKEVKSLADRASKQTNVAWGKAYDPKLSKIDSQIQRLMDRADQQSSNFAMAGEKAEKILESIQGAAKAVRDMADGQGDLEEQFLHVCNTLETKTQKVMGGIRANFANAGGEFDRVAFNVMTFKEDGKDKGKRELLDEAVTALKRGIGALNAGKKELSQNKISFDRTLSTLPDFAKPENPKFKEVLAALENAKSIYVGYDREQQQLGRKAEKVAESYKSAL